MTAGIRASKQTLMLLAALRQSPSRWQYGYALSRETDLMSGTLYPILMRLEQRGWLETRWETPAQNGRPPRHMYRLTASGRACATEALSKARASGVLNLALQRV